jgi:hypothetical protein
MTEHTPDLLKRDLADLARLYNQANPSRRLSQQLTLLPSKQQPGTPLLRRLLRLLGWSDGAPEKTHGFSPLDDSLLDSAVAGAATPGLVPPPETKDQGASIIDMVESNQPPADQSGKD